MTVMLDTVGLLANVNYKRRPILCWHFARKGSCLGRRKERPMNMMMSTSRIVAAAATALALLAGCKEKQEVSPPTGAAPAKAAIVSAEKNSFDQVTAKLNKGGNLYLYLSTEQVLSGLSNHLAEVSNIVSALPNIPGTGRETLGKVFAVLGGIVKESGISEISGLGMSSIAREPGFYYSKVVVHHYPGQNAGLAWTLFGKAAHPLKIVDLLPESTAMAGASDFDLALAWTNIEQAVRTLDVPQAAAALDQAPAKFRQVTGLDLDAALHSLGGEYAIIFTLDEHKTITLPLGEKPLEIPNPALCLLFKVNSDVIFDRVDQALKDSPVLNKFLSKVEEPGLKMRTVTFPIPIPVEVRPSLARVGDYLLLASSDSLVREIVAVKTGQKKGFTTTDEFKRLSQDIPNAGNNFSLVTRSLGGTVRQIQERSMAAQNMDAEALKTFQNVLQRSTNCAAYTVGVNGPEGWEAFSNGSQSPATLLLLPAAAVVGLGAAIAIPNFVKARATSQKNACINNLRLFDAAKQQWALENKKQSTDTPAMSDLRPYLGRGVKGEMPVCPAGGAYTLGSVGEKPTCSISDHVLP
jgi:hypothetical protein